MARRRRRRTGPGRRARRARGSARGSSPRRPTWRRVGTAARATPRALRLQLHAFVAKVGNESRRPTAQREHLPVRLDVELARKLAAQAQELAVERLRLARLELRALERLARLRVREVFAGERAELRELALAALARRVGDERVDVVGEELERPRLVVLLALEEERRREREEHDGERNPMSVARQPIADGSVADLIVVLRAHDQPLRLGARELADEPLHRPERIVVPLV